MAQKITKNKLKRIVESVINSSENDLPEWNFDEDSGVMTIQMPDGSMEEFNHVYDHYESSKGFDFDNPVTHYISEYESKDGKYVAKFDLTETKYGIEVDEMISFEQVKEDKMNESKKISLSELKKIVKKALKEESDSELKKLVGYDYSTDGLYADYVKQKKYTIKHLQNTLEHLDILVEYFLEVVQDCEDNLAELKSTVNSGNYLMSDYKFLRDKFLELVQESRFALVDIVTEDSPANSIKRITSDTEKLRQLRKKIEDEID